MDRCRGVSNEWWGEGGVRGPYRSLTYVICPTLITIKLASKTAPKMKNEDKETCTNSH